MGQGGDDAGRGGLEGECLALEVDGVPPVLLQHRHCNIDVQCILSANGNGNVLMTHSTHFIYCYMALDHSDSEKGNPMPPHGLHDWCNKGCGMFYPVCGMVHIKEPLLLIGKSSHVVLAVGFLSYSLRERDVAPW